MNAALIDCTIRFNSADNASGIYRESGGSPFQLSGCTVCGNQGSAFQVTIPFIDGGGNTIVEECTTCSTDTNGDGVTNVLDLIELLLAFGTACP